VLATYLFFYFCSGILHYSYPKDRGRFLEQPQRSKKLVLDFFKQAKAWRGY